MNGQWRRGLLMTASLMLGVVTPLAAQEVSQKLRRECCVRLSGDWTPNPDGAKDSKGAPKGTCYFSNAAGISNFAVCMEDGGKTKKTN